MTARHLRLVVSNQSAAQPCSCRTWRHLDRITRDLIICDFMLWAGLLHQVHLKMMARGEHVAIDELSAAEFSKTRRVMTEICTWAECARVTLELRSASLWGSEAEQLTRSFESLGFEPDTSAGLFFAQRAMVRYPGKGQGHHLP
ncbi:hypothetical protein Rhe02_83360 [Rhizocola hellebori]|uniref:Uncharacterized protein n=1 Tax=Rhizocola hellebori TaxID=1392758 RepID=A0A8J3VKA6_9ACTN|nr:hypothetical protein Rhe02_83360 [Rhizocola hellebori]